MNNINFKLQSGSLYEDLNLKKKKSLFYPILFVASRILISAALCSMKPIEGMQIPIITFTPVLLAAYAAAAHPFTDYSLNIFEVWNNFMVAILAALVAGFSDYNLSYSEQYYMGKGWIGLFSALWILNCVFVVVHSIRQKRNNKEIKTAESVQIV